ncbi:hypothetical protein AB6D11_06425 [Vibrio splendidus]
MKPSSSKIIKGQVLNVQYLMRHRWSKTHRQIEAKVTLQTDKVVQSRRCNMPSNLFKMLLSLEGKPATLVVNGRDIIAVDSGSHTYTAMLVGASAIFTFILGFIVAMILPIFGGSHWVGALLMGSGLLGVYITQIFSIRDSLVNVKVRTSRLRPITRLCVVSLLGMMEDNQLLDVCHHPFQPSPQQDI